MSEHGDVARAAAAASLALGAEGLRRLALTAVLDVLPAAALLLDPASGDVVHANPRATAIAGDAFGRAGEDVRSTAPVFDAEGRPMPLEGRPSARIARGEQLAGFRMEWELPRGRRSLLLSSAVARLADGPVAVVVFEDVTALRSAELRARFLARASDELTRSLDFERTLQAVATIAVPERADWCAIDVLDDAGHLRRVAIAHSDPAKEDLGWRLSRRYPPAVDRGVAAEVLRTHEAVLMPAVADEDLVAAAQDEDHLALLRDMGLSGGIAVPLLARGRALGVLTFVFEAGRRPDDLDLALAVELGRRAAGAIENARLYRERSHIAQVLQRSLLPPRVPVVPGHSIATRYRAAGEGHEVGGDFYDVFQRGDDEWVVVMGDVCGKGPEAASLTALARWTVRASALRRGSPGRVLADLNAAIVLEHGDAADTRFMTAICACLAPGGVRVASAGHPPPLLVRSAGEVVPLPGAGPLLGVLDDPVLPEQHLEPAAGDALVLYTDGVSEAGAPVRPLGVDGIAEALAGAAGRSAEALADAVVDAALARSQGRPRDDVAVLVVRRDPA